MKLLRLTSVVFGFLMFCSLGHATNTTMEITGCIQSCMNPVSLAIEVKDGSGGVMSTLQVGSLVTQQGQCTHFDLKTTVTSKSNQPPYDLPSRCQTSGSNDPLLNGIATAATFDPFSSPQSYCNFGNLNGSTTCQGLSGHSGTHTGGTLTGSSSSY